MKRDQKNSVDDQIRKAQAKLDHMDPTQRRTLQLEGYDPFENQVTSDRSEKHAGKGIAEPEVI